MRHDYDATVRYGLYLADLRPTQNDSRGTINYAVGLAAELARLLDPSEQLFVLANQEISQYLQWGSDGAHPVVDVVAAPRGIAGRLAMDHLRSIGWAARRQLDVLHLPKGHLPMWTPHRITTVVTIHDDIPVLYARNHFGPSGRTAKSLYFARAVRRSVAGADRVLAVSAFSAARLASLATVDPAKIVVTYEAPSLPAIPFVPLEQRDPLIVILGSRFPHKRTEQAVRWVDRLLHTPAGAGLRLVVTGQLNPDMERLCAELGIERVPDVLSSIVLARLFARCRLLVFASAYEGFGLPPVEAYGLGAAVVYRKTGAMAEVLDTFPGGFVGDRYDHFAAAATEAMALDDDALLELRARMRERFQWSEVARLTLRAYRSASQTRAR